MSDYTIIVNRAAKLCSTGEKCEHDMRQKMIQWGLEADDTDKAMKFLLENKFIDDERFAHFFVKDKLRFNKWGRIKLTYALRQKHITEELIESAIQAIDQEKYMEILDQIILNKIRSLGEIKTAANKAKVLRFAAQKGFTSEEIFASINRVEQMNDDS